jgi:hypothetical protein
MDLDGVLMMLLMTVDTLLLMLLRQATAGLQTRISQEITVPTLILIATSHQLSMCRCCQDVCEGGGW